MRRVEDSEGLVRFWLVWLVLASRQGINWVGSDSNARSGPVLNRNPEPPPVRLDVVERALLEKPDSLSGVLTAEGLEEARWEKGVRVRGREKGCRRVRKDVFLRLPACRIWTGEDAQYNMEAKESDKPV